MNHRSLVTSLNMNGTRSWKKEKRLLKRNRNTIQVWTKPLLEPLDLDFYFGVYMFFMKKFCWGSFNPCLWAGLFDTLAQKIMLELEIGKFALMEREWFWCLLFIHSLTTNISLELCILEWFWELLTVLSSTERWNSLFMF